MVYTDGACSGNPGPGGWAWIEPDGPSASGAEPQTTNQRMEITAAWRAVEANDGPLEIRSDSTYVVNCFRDRWWEGWLRRGWQNSQRKPVANRDLWEPFVSLVRERGDVVFSWVKGHSGDRWNDEVDRLAVAALKALQNGYGPAGGASSALAATSAATPAAMSGGGAVGDVVPLAPGSASYQQGVAGHPLVVLGHQPPELGGYDPNPWADAVRRRLRDIIAAKAGLEPELVVVSGLRLGAEQLGAEAALEAGVPLVVVLPYPDPDARWPSGRRARFKELCAAATTVLTLQRKAPDTTARAAAAMTRRDAWLARHGAEAILVWDGVDERLARLHRSLVDHLGEDVWVLDPREVAP
ncbi:MAG: RNase H family protein [Acidimicrobiales bacterium]